MRIPRDVPELHTEHWFSIFDQLADLGVFQLTFGGGEPWEQELISAGDIDIALVRLVL